MSDDPTPAVSTVDDPAGLAGGDSTAASDASTGSPADPGPGAASSDSAVDVSYQLELIPQPDKLSCWAGSMAMLVSFRRQVSVSPETVAEEAGQTLRRSYGWDELEAVRDHFGFQSMDLPSEADLYYSPDTWRGWLAAGGPLWVTTVGNPSHAIVVAGLRGDLTPAGTTIHILNPWDTRATFDDDEVDFHPANEGYEYDQSFEDFAADFGNVGLALPSGDWRVLYLPPSS